MFIKRSRGRFKDLDPDQVFLDSSNLPQFDLDRFEGQIEKPIRPRTAHSFSAVVFLILIIFAGKAWALQIENGEEYAKRSEANRLDRVNLFASRGSIVDRNGERLAWNTVAATSSSDIPERRIYTKREGFAHVLGYVTYPAKDKNGYYYRTAYEGVAGVEKAYDALLKGEHGIKITETNALGSTTSESLEKQPVNGQNLTLSIDARVEEKLYESISGLAHRVGFSGGAGGIMDVNTGEIIALTSFPEYTSAAMADGDTALVKKYLDDSVRKPFLNRFVDGLYTPGSIVKPFVALGALSENIISPDTTIVSTGSISVPNPYDPKRKTVFSDWKAHGPVDMKKAIAVSSNVYFYEVGGGFEKQKGLGISNLEKYFSIFGLGKKTEGDFFDGPSGTIPSPEWKEETFPGDPWRIGDTYFTSIGQYGFQVTPLQILRAYGAIANGGVLIPPTIISQASSTSAIEGESLPFGTDEFNVIHDGMRLAVMSGTGGGLNVPYVKVAAKTGTAELGALKQFVNSWVVGFWPYEKPRYAFVVLMEHGPRGNTYGGVYVMRELLDWFSVYAPEYLKTL